MIRNRIKHIGSWMLAGMLVFTAAGAAEGTETAQEPAQPTPATQEEGYSEIEALLEINEMGDTEGMSLEEITDAFTNGAMKEYLNEKAGFSMLYPSVFEWDENGLIAASADGKAMLQIESISNGGVKNLQIIAEMTGKSEPEAQVEYTEKSGLLKMKRTGKENAMITVDLYLETDAWIHHAYMVYPADQDEVYDPYIPYMLNSMTSSEAEQG